MLSNCYHYARPANEAERAYLEWLIRDDYERCHPGETLDDAKRRASFSKEDTGSKKARDFFVIGWPLPQFELPRIEQGRNPRSLPDGSATSIGQAAGLTPKSFGLSIRSTRVYSSRTALNASSPLCRMRRKRQERVMMH
jgi:hypothetical protein